LRCALTHYWDLLEVRQPPIRALRIPPKPRYSWRGIEDEDAIRLAAEALRRRPEGLAVLIGLFTGFRRSEIAAMRWDRFSPDLTSYTVRGKGGYEDTQPIPPDLIPLLEEHRSAFVYLFPGEKSRHVNPATIWHWAKEIAEAAGLGDFTTHQLRHTAIGWVYDYYGMRAAQRFARHVRLDTTQIYTRAREQEVREAVSNFPWLKGVGADAAKAA
jgi:integrase